MSPESGPLLTLEPLIDAVCRGAEAAGWELSGMQKTTSHQFEGRWEGEATRSAYLFFHLPEEPADASLDVYLDETSRGLTGDLALVLSTGTLSQLTDVETTLSTLAGVSTDGLPEGYRRPVTLRFAMDCSGTPAGATGEARLKLRIPRTALDAGPRTVASLTTATGESFRRMLADERLVPLLATVGDG